MSTDGGQGVTGEIWAALIGAMVIVLGQIISSFYLAGRITGKLDALGERMTKTETAITDQWHRLSDHDQRLTRSEVKLDTLHP